MLTGEAHPLSFKSREQLARVLNPPRRAMLRHRRRRPTAALATLAEAFGRDAREAREDVEARVAAGLIDGGRSGPGADHDEIRATIAV